MKLYRLYPDVERDLVDYLGAALPAAGETVTVGAAVPEAWVRTDATHVLVAVDDAEIVAPIMTAALVRLTVFAASTTEAKRVAGVTLARLLLNEVGGVHPESGPVAARDPASEAELATFTVRYRTRSITPAS